MRTQNTGSGDICMRLHKPNFRDTFFTKLCCTTTPTSCRGWWFHSEKSHRASVFLDFLWHHVVPTERARRVPVVQPLFQTLLMENMAAGELVDLCLGLELSQADGALLLRAFAYENWLVLHWWCPASEFLHVWFRGTSATFGWVWGLHREVFPRRYVDANDVEDRTKDLLEDGNWYRCVSKDYTEHSSICWSWVRWYSHFDPKQLERLS